MPIPLDQYMQLVIASLTKVGAKGPVDIEVSVFSRNIEVSVFSRNNVIYAGRSDDCNSSTLKIHFTI